jgi:hypothetical protein
MTQTTKPRWVKRVLWLLLGTIGLTYLLIAWWRSSSSPTSTNPFEPPEMAAARYAKRDVVGDLGGVPVTIPRHFANFVEYDDDPGWGEKRKGPRPQRTHQSKLSSFGYYTRFPDMAGESSAELMKDKRSYSASKTPWILVGINTGKDYPGDGFLDRSIHATVETHNGILKYENYEKLPTKEYGLTVYAAAGIDPKTNRPYREDTDAKDVFVSRGKDGRVIGHVRCSNRNVPAPPCTHDFSLEPDMHAKVYLSYRRGMLPKWREMQEAVSQQILAFRVTPAIDSPAKP